jgi:hypothetical protein
MLVLHEAADPDVLVAYARTFELFEIPDSGAGSPGRPRSPAEIITERVRHADQWVRIASADGTDLRSVALIGLIGAAGWQVLRGQVLPAATTLIWYALAVAAADRRTGGGGRENPAADRQEAVDASVE